MPRPRFARLDSEKRRSILDTAAEEFALHGFDGASYNAIIEKLGLSKGVMYYYFDDKRDLFTTIVLEAVEQFTSYIGDREKPSSKEAWWERTKELFDRSLEFFEQDPQAARLIVIASKSPEMYMQTYSNMQAMTQDWLVTILTDGQSLGAVRRDLPMDLLVCCIFGLGQASDMWMLGRWQERDRGGRQEDSDLIFALFKEFFQARSYP